MEEKETIIEETVAIPEPVQDASANTEQQPMTLEQQLEELIKLRTGNLEVKASVSELKYLKNSLNSRVEWKGPNEAYLAIISNLSLAQALSEVDMKADEVTVSLPSSVIESLNFFLGRVTGTGLDAAQKLFSAAMV